MRRVWAPAVVLLSFLWGCQRDTPAPGDAVAIPTVSVPAIASAPPAPSAPASSAAPANALAWSMTALPTTLTMKSRDAFELTISAHNRGSQVLDTGRDHLRLRVNGQPSTGFRLNWGNGHRDRRWRALPPGDEVSETRPFGKMFFPRPGEYALVLEYDEVEVARASVAVTGS